MNYNCNLEKRQDHDKNEDAMDKPSQQELGEGRMEVRSLLEELEHTRASIRSHKDALETQAALHRRQELLWKKERKILADQVKELESVVYEQAKSCKTREKFHQRERQNLLEEVYFLRNQLKQVNIPDPTPSPLKKHKTDSVRSTSRGKVRWLDTVKCEVTSTDNPQNAPKPEASRRIIDFASPKSIVQQFANHLHIESPKRPVQTLRDKLNNPDPLPAISTDIDDLSTITNLPITMRHHLLVNQKARSNSRIMDRRTSLLDVQPAKPKSMPQSKPNRMAQIEHLALPQFLTRALSHRNVNRDERSVSGCSTLTGTTMMTSESRSTYGLHLHDTN